MSLDINKFIGMTKKGSQDLAEKNNLIYRLIRIDNDKFNDYPVDDRTEQKDRVCIEIDGGKVSKATYN